MILIFRAPKHAAPLILRRTDCLNWEKCVMIDLLVCFTVKLSNMVTRMNDSIDITRKAWKFLVYEKLTQY
jgi:hypothetical protein